MADLTPLFTPASVAILGFDSETDVDAVDMLRSLKSAGYAGGVFPIAEHTEKVEGIACVPSLTAMPRKADLIVIAAPLSDVPDLLAAAGETRHTHALIVSSGIGEQKGEGQNLQKSIWEAADKYRITVAGTNSAGIVNLTSDGGFAAALFRDLPLGPGANGGFAILSQSVTVTEQLLESANGMSIPVSTVISTGSCLALDVADYLDHLTQDSAVSGVMIYFESLPDRQRFQEACRRCAVKKPVLAVVGGRSPEGQIAVQNRSGALSLSAEEVDALAAEAGLMRVGSLKRMLLAAKGLSFHPKGIGPNVLILGNTGSAGVLASDAAMEHGLVMPALPPALTWSLGADLPDAATADNPVDLLMDASEERFGAALHKALELGADEFDALLTIHVAPFRDDPTPVVEIIAACSASATMPILHCMLGRLDRKTDWFKTLTEAGLPVFDDPEEMVACASLLAQYDEIRARFGA